MPALWYLDPDDIEGPDHGLALRVKNDISPDLLRDIEVWIDDWSSWHDCAEEDAAPPARWVDAGAALVERLEPELEPLGYRIVARLY